MNILSNKLLKLSMKFYVKMFTKVKLQVRFHEKSKTMSVIIRQRGGQDGRVDRQVGINI